MLEPIATKKIIDIIQNKDSYLADISVRVKNLMSYVTTDQMTVDTIHELFMPKPMANPGMLSSEGSEHDYSDVIEVFVKRQVYRKNEMRELLIELLDEKELVERVWGCYMSLPKYPHDLLQKYYEEHMILEGIALDYDVSLRTIYRHKEMALKMVSERYMSGIPLNIIFKLQQKQNMQTRDSNNNTKVIFEIDKGGRDNE